VAPLKQAMNLSRLDACKNRKVVRWYWTQTSNHNSQSVVDGRVNTVGVSTMIPGRSTVLLLSLECTTARVAVSRGVAPAPASRLRRVTRDVSPLRSDSRCRRYVSDLSNVTPIYLGSEQKGRVFDVVFDFQHMFSFLVFELD